ncbi:hypothetical protein ACLKA7_013997 [Drosophila subpalustris]
MCEQMLKEKKDEKSTAAPLRYLLLARVMSLVAPLSTLTEASLEAQKGIRRTSIQLQKWNNDDDNACR